MTSEVSSAVPSDTEASFSMFRDLALHDIDRRVVGLARGVARPSAVTMLTMSAPASSIAWVTVCVAE